MGYHQIQPSQRLRSLVESIWVQDSDLDASKQKFRPTRVLPTAKVDLVLYYRDPFVQLDRGRRKPIPRFSVCGQRTGPIDVRATGKSGVVVVNFYPWAAQRLLGMPANEVTDQTLDLREVWGGERSGRFEHQFDLARSLVPRVAVIESFLNGLLERGSEDGAVVEAVRRIEASWGAMAIGQLALDLGISCRQLVQRFSAVVGVPPKKFARIIRFQKALFCLRSGMHWSDFIDRCGHYDQAHYIHEMKRFSGLSPTELNVERRNTPLMEQFNGTRASSYFYNTTYLEVV